MEPVQDQARRFFTALSRGDGDTAARVVQAGLEMPRLTPGYPHALD